MHPKRDWLGIENKIKKDCFCKKSTESFVCLHIPRRIEKTDKGKEQRVFSSGLWLKRWTPTTTNCPQTHPRHFSQALPEAQHHWDALSESRMEGGTGEAAPPRQFTYCFPPLKLLRLGSVLALPLRRCVCFPLAWIHVLHIPTYLTSLTPQNPCFNATILLRPFLIILFKNFNPPICFLPLPLSCFVSFSIEGILVCPRYPPGHAHIHSPNLSALLCFREADLMDSVSRLTCLLAPFWVWPKGGGRRRFERGWERIRDVFS